ncbi:Bug family tripartite tricarboxylate transporter substrate binding protein [Rhodoplanes sp. Z2-YC6860]|uniref:Bug family tripartite tricarboxylate transporter substrate binding protein n=1 Tax=Rhodoplanes sp. Z2-YC6860 TaxID=674703 RepID=UPI00078DA919|nr:tripartite tricarboxylate transporter substrate binding protein [Rhodoplanes sp. Z2-YC6860]AMN45416.1 DHA2 family major facilitator superfamily protein [Rhodoplanes sp. Z2-YC6860]
MRIMLRAGAALFGLFFGISSNGLASAQPYPNRTVTIVVTSAAGGLTDVLTRGVSQKLSQLWSQPVVIENRGGAGHSFAATAVKAAAPDGYTLLATETGMFTIQPFLHSPGRLAYDATTDFIPVAGFASIPMALLVNPAVPAKSVEELLKLAKDKPSTISYGTAGLGTAPHMGALLLETMTGAKFTAVHYRGASPALNDVIGGHIDMIIMGPSIALPTVKAGKLGMLGFGSLQRVAQFADVPTIAETVPGYDASVAFGLFARSGTPPEVIARVNSDVQKVINDAEFRARFLEPQVVQPVPGSLEGFSAYLRSEAAKWSKVVGDAKLQID